MDFRRLALIAVMAATACTTTPPMQEPPTRLPEVRPGYVAGYLQPDQLPNGLALLPPPPAAGTAAFAADQEFHRAMGKFRDTPRFAQSTKDAELRFPQAASHFSCVLDIPISEEATPHLNMLLRRVRMDASRANDDAKDRYQRERPFMTTGETICVPEEQPRYKADSYPSGHASIGWAWALVLAELVPDRSNAILQRGLEFGLSRAICAVHWRSDIEAGRILGASTVSRLHTDPVFNAQIGYARREIAAARAAGARSPLDCAAETRAFASAK
jgi:acid phosphatase (class A)